MQIKDWLTGPPSRLNIISIVGMGGIGKTTLAKNLYGDSLIKHYFDIRAWTVVSQTHSIREMLMDLLDSIRHGGGELQHKSIEQLAEILYKSLKGRRYLIVLDDVWDARAWDDIKRFFPDDNNGGRIILTTRLLEVAIYANSSPRIHHMSLLSSKASWNLLREKVFGKECCPVGLEKIGKKIARNCKGLPLAIIVVSGLLSKGCGMQEYWMNISENVKSTVTGNDDQLMEILSLSYNSLPHHLKSCFLYMGVFPEHCEIFVSQLIKLWIAEGFVKPLPHKSLEEVAEDYLKDLIDRSLIMVQMRNHNGGIKTCVIHDSLRDLCVKKAHDEKFLQIINWDVGVFPHGRNSQRRIFPKKELGFLLEFSVTIFDYELSITESIGCTHNTVV
ncbi:hypothetical protein CDL12_04786 [Handroanthus impetiginosus]|uniref:Uncharacterized protein n=1 Tax=Handroanthus impetiginosus TaxID=429701 RepID=A0A2G9HY96_9LAMI|nr:hypothetical protein CDL12_04786 [Handroanthus impetiginosus]